MTKEKIEELKKILYSKIDQLSNIIGDNAKTLHYDLFKINKKNLSSGIEKIKDLLNSDSNNELEVLVMKKDLVEVTKDFLEKNIFDDINKEKRKLKIVRNIYLVLIFILLIVGLIVYGNHFSKNLYSSECKKNIYTTVKNNINQKTNTLKNKNNYLSGNKIKNNINGVKKIGEKNSSGIQTNILTGNYIFGTILSYKKIDKDKINGQIKISKNYKNKGININKIIKKYNISNKTNIMLLYTGARYENISGGIFSGTYLIKGKLKENLLLGSILTGNKIVIKKEKIEDENEKILKGKKLEEYKKEKARKCPYDGIIKVTVFALNFRENNTKYSKKLGVLKKGTELEVLGCKKNLKSNSWWYKVKIKKTQDIGWVSTIGVGK